MAEESQSVHTGCKVWCMCKFTCSMKSNLCTIICSYITNHTIMVNSNSTHVHSTTAVGINWQCEVEILLIDALSYVSKSTIRVELKPLNSVAFSSCPRPNVTVKLSGG